MTDVNEAARKAGPTLDSGRPAASAAPVRVGSPGEAFARGAPPGTGRTVPLGVTEANPREARGR